MIEITGLPNFSYVYIHTGNTIEDTAGCPLCGFGFPTYPGRLPSYSKCYGLPNDLS